MLSPQFLAASIFALGLAPEPARNSVQTPQRRDDRFDAYDPDGEAILTPPTKAAQAKASREPGMK
jgi:hypothetical protein